MPCSILTRGIVAEPGPGFGNVRAGQRHIARLRRLALDDCLASERVLQQLDQTVERHRLRFAEVEDFVAELIPCACLDAFDNVA